MTNEELVMRIQTGDSKGEHMAELCEQCKGIVIDAAKMYKDFEEWEDLKQVAYMGLIETARDWEPSGGVCFCVFAKFRIRQIIRHHIDNNRRLVRIPQKKREDISTMKKTAEDFHRNTGRDPTHGELISLLGWQPRRMQSTEECMIMSFPDSLETPATSKDSDETIGDILPGGVDPEEVAIKKAELEEKEELKTVLWECVDSLKGKNQARVIRARYQRNEKQKDIGEQLGKDFKYVSEVEKNALKALKKYHGATLYPYLYGDAMQGIGAGAFAITWTSATEREAIKALG